MRTATVFSLSLFPKAFLLNRVCRADVILVLTDTILDDWNHVNRCTIRTAGESFKKLTIPVTRINLPIDEARVENPRGWSSQFTRDVRKGYRGLRRAAEVEQLANTCIGQIESPWLTDYLMTAFLKTIDALGLQRKTIVRGSSEYRHRFPNDSEYFLDTCIEHDCDRLIVGHHQLSRLHQRLFRRNDVELVPQKWDGSKEIPAHDSILDILARLPLDEISSQLNEARKFQAVG